MYALKNMRFSAVLFWAIIAVLIVLSFLILRPFLIPLVSAFVLAYLIKPIYQRIESASGNKHVGAIVALILAIGIIIIPIVLVSTALIGQAEESLNVSDLQTTLDEKLSAVEVFEKLGVDFTDLKSKGLALLISIIGATISQIPVFILSVAITVLATYYMLIRWEFLVVKIKEFIPFRNKDSLFDSISRTTNYIIYGYFLLAIVEFIVASIGFYISGIQAYLLLPLLLAMTAFIPGIGPAMVWVPTFIVQLISGDYFAAITILITGLVISILIETLLFSKLLGTKASIHPLMILLGILGGIPLFGIFGFIVGPLILAYTVKILEQSLNNQ